MSPLRCTVAFEIFSKSCDGNPIENLVLRLNPPSGPKVFADPAAGGLLSGPDVFTPIHCRLRKTLQLLDSPPVPTALTRKHTEASSPKSVSKFYIGDETVFADPAAGGLFFGPDARKTRLPFRLNRCGSTVCSFEVIADLGRKKPILPKRPYKQ